MAETTYYEDKVYLPKGVREKLGLIDGDVLHIEVVEKGVAKLSVVRGCRKAKLAREMLENPPNLGRIKGRLLGKRFMRILLDTNILVHAYNKASPNQKVASSIIERAMAGEIEACIAQQVLFEFFAVITNAKRVESPMPLDIAAELCVDLWECDEIGKIAASESAPREVFRLVKSKRLSGSTVFDCILAVSAKANKIDVIYTENVRDFNKYGFIKVQNPFIEL